MQIGTAEQSLSSALKSALEKDLDAIEGKRPLESDCQVYLFQQCWSDTSLGFGGMAGQMISSAYTVVILGWNTEACVYFAGRLAYTIHRPNQKFFVDLSNHRMERRGGHSRYFDSTE